jgi:hypothetical protein
VKTDKPTHSSEPGAIKDKHPVGILIALAFFAGTPLWMGEDLLPFANPKGAERCSPATTKKQTSVSWPCL